jgi:hypothetical protein
VANRRVDTAANFILDGEVVYEVVFGGRVTVGMKLCSGEFCVMYLEIGTLFAIRVSTELMFTTENMQQRLHIVPPTRAVCIMISLSPIDDEALLLTAGRIVYTARLQDAVTSEAAHQSHTAHNLEKQVENSLGFLSFLGDCPICL